MKRFELRIRVKLKEGILDPQAEAILKALHSLEYSQVKKIDCEKTFVVFLEAEDEASAIRLGREMAQNLLANLVMENFEVELAQGDEAR